MNSTVRENVKASLHLKFLGKMEGKLPIYRETETSFTFPVGYFDRKSSQRSCFSHKITKNRIVEIDESQKMYICGFAQNNKWRYAISKIFSYLKKCQQYSFSWQSTASKEGGRFSVFFSMPPFK